MVNAFTARGVQVLDESFNRCESISRLSKVIDISQKARTIIMSKSMIRMKGGRFFHGWLKEYPFQCKIYRRSILPG